jgi:hypothetical protein
MTMITPSYLGETIEYSSLHACRSTLEDPTLNRRVDILIIYEAAGSSVTGPAGFAPIEGWPFGGTQGRPSDQTGRQP